MVLNYRSMYIESNREVRYEGSMVLAAAQQKAQKRK